MNTQFFENIDYSLMREQKQHLLNINGVTTDQTLALIGVIHLIDSIQDYAVDVLGKPADEVFTL